MYTFQWARHFSVWKFLYFQVFFSNISSREREIKPETLYFSVTRCSSNAAMDLACKGAKEIVDIIPGRQVLTAQDTKWTSVLLSRFKHWGRKVAPGDEVRKKNNENPKHSFLNELDVHCILWFKYAGGMIICQLVLSWLSSWFWVLTSSFESGGHEGLWISCTLLKSDFRMERVHLMKLCQPLVMKVSFNCLWKETLQLLLVSKD